MRGLFRVEGEAGHTLDSLLRPSADVWELRDESVNEVARYHSKPSMGRILIATSSASFAGATAVAAYVGYLRMVTGFLGTHGEGYILMALRRFLSRHALYYQVVLASGPLF